eukprot:scaffold952_cov249-Pinguiococcus_pyrenoidosus.AAC.7
MDPSVRMIQVQTEKSRLGSPSPMQRTCWGPPRIQAFCSLATVVEDVAKRDCRLPLHQLVELTL